MSNSTKTRTEVNTNGVENRARVDNVVVNILNIPRVNIPLWYRRLIQAMGKATVNSMETTTETQGVVTTQ